MPIYEYQCKSCEHELEKLQRMSDPALTDCPACNQSELKRLVSAAGFRLKGSGWYETDFKKGSKRNLHDSGGSGNGASKPGTSVANSTTKSSDTKSSSKGSDKGSDKGSGKAASKKTDAA
jgi:putative FmdB family regulatory protein